METAEDNQQLCSAINYQLMHILTEIEDKNAILHYREGRRKRGSLNIVDNLASDLFGVLDDRGAKHYEEEIQKI